jgi:hypothetical protein
VTIRERIAYARALYIAARQQAEARKIERLATLISGAQITGEYPEDTSYSELAEIAFWDAVARRVKELMDEHQREQGVIGVIDIEGLRNGEIDG